MTKSLLAQRQHKPEAPTPERESIRRPSLLIQPRQFVLGSHFIRGLNKRSKRAKEPSRKLNPEILTGASGRIVSNAEMQREFGGSRGGGDTYLIHAEGAELGAWNRIQRGLEARDRQVAAAAVRATHEMAARRPQRG